MLSIEVGGSFHGMAWDEGDPPPAHQTITSTTTDQYGRSEPNPDKTYRLTHVLEQAGGQFFAIYRMDEDPRADPSPFEELVQECAEHRGYTIAVDTADLSSMRITALGPWRREVVSCYDVHDGALVLARLLHWPRPQA
jgi:hypothetical protein